MKSQISVTCTALIIVLYIFSIFLTVPSGYMCKDGSHQADRSQVDRRKGP
jgi:hypothetical protein